MKITDEQIKELVKFSRIKVPLTLEYKSLFAHLEKVLVVKILHNVLENLHLYCDIKKYRKTHKSITRISKLLDNWTNGDQDIQFDIFNKIKRSIESAHSAKEKECLDNDTLKTFYASINAAHYTLFSDLFEYYRMKASADAMLFADSLIDNKPIVIKTILDYYGEDFETFEALYL